MPLHCLPTQTHFDVRCPVCGEGFLLLTEPTLRSERLALHGWAATVLESHHAREGRKHHFHPAEIFEIPDPDPRALAKPPAPWPYRTRSS